MALFSRLCERLLDSAALNLFQGFPDSTSIKPASPHLALVSQVEARDVTSQRFMLQGLRTAVSLALSRWLLEETTPKRTSWAPVAAS